MMKIINKFNPLIKKYSRKLNYDGADTDLIITFIETVYKMPLTNSNDSCIVNYINKSITNKYIFLSKVNAQIKHSEKALELYNLEDKNNIYIEDSILIRSSLDKLSNIEKKILIEEYIKDYAETKIAKELKVSRQAVNKTKNKALKN